MGRGNAIPKKFFGSIEPKRQIPWNNVLFLGAVALGSASILSFERSAELLNFGALLAFMGVNAAAFARYYWREERKLWTNLVPPIRGFLVCLLLWLSLSWPAKVVGVIWMIIGIGYGAIKTRGFKAELVTFDVPEDAI
jgi:putrescine importer